MTPVKHSIIVHCTDLISTDSTSIAAYVVMHQEQTHSTAVIVQCFIHGETQNGDTDIFSNW